MNPDQLFQVANQGAVVGWLLLGAGLFLPGRWRARVLFLGGRLVPLALCLAYVVVMAFAWGNRRGGFGSLEAVSLLFTSGNIVLAGWMHYLAFDLLVGRWQVDHALAAPGGRLLRLLTLPCLFATLMFGPGGLLLFLLLRSATPFFFPNRGVST